MNWLPGVPGPDVTVRLVAVLGHTLWQALVLSVLLWVALRLLRPDRPGLRYALCCMTLAAVVVSAFATAAFLVPRNGQSTLLPHEPALSVPGHNTGFAPPTPPGVPSPDQSASTSPPSSPANPGIAISSSSGSSLLPQLSKFLAALWAVGVLLMLIRLLVSVKGATRLKRQGEPVTDAHIIRVFQDLQTALRITRTVGLRISAHVASPVVIGILRPAILLPSTFLLGMPPEVIRAAIAHELAHIRRHDYLVNLGQMVIEALLFFNPCVWWISNQVRLERELCCDHIAVAITGDPRSYVTALDHVATAGGGAIQSSAAALYMRPHSRGTLVHRVRCILFPHHRSSLRLPWYSLLTTLATWGLIFTGLWMSSTTGVALARAILSESERLSLVKQAQQEYGVPGIDRIDETGEPERTTVTGTLRLPDGAPANLRTVVNTVSRQPRLASGGGIPVVDGKFSDSIVAGQVHMAVRYPDHAPAFLGPYLLGAYTPLSNLDITLDRGYESAVRVTDYQDKPVTSATVRLFYLFPDRQNPLIQQSYATGTDGTVTIDHASTHPVRLEVAAPGFEPASQEAEQLPVNSAIQVKLRPAQITSGIVVDDATSEPIRNAVLMRAAIRGAESQTFDISTTAAVTDAEGRFVIDDLRHGMVYDFLVEAPPRRPAWLTNIKTGDTDLEVRMGAPLVIQGTVSGQPEKATIWDHAARKRYPAIRVISWLRNPGQPGMNYRESFVPLKIKDGVGHFSAEGLSPGNIRLMWDAGTPKQLNLDVQESVTNLELSTESGEGPGDEWTRRAEKLDQTTRTVVLKFDTGSATPPAGTIYLNYSGLPGDPGSAQISPVPITGAEMRFVVTTPSGVQCTPKGTLGYWFKDQAFKVPVGNTDYVHTVYCVPAGSISGTVLNASGQPDPRAFVSVRVVEPPASLKENSSGSLTPDSVTLNNHGRFHITPLPLGGTYAVNVYKDGFHVTSDNIEITESLPNQTITAQLGKGVPFEVQVIDEARKPIVNIPIRLTYKVDGVSNHVITEQLTDAEGRFRVDNLNPNPRGSYHLDIPSRKDYQPVTMTVTAGQSHPPITLKRGLTARGRIISKKTGQPLAGETAFAVPSQYTHSLPKPWIPVLSEQPTGPDGKFQFSNLPPGEHIFRVQMKGSLNNPKATAGSAEEIEILVSF